MRRAARTQRGSPRAVRGRRIGLRIVVGAAVLAVAAFAGYAAAARWLLSGPRLRAWINTTPETTLVDWDEAVSIWPGTVRLKNLRIRGSDDNVEWIVRLEQARADYSIPALLERRFQVQRVAGSGLSFRLRQKLEPSDPSKPPPGFLPPIAGFADPPLRRPASAASAPASEGRPWTVDVGGIALDRFEEIWIDSYRFEGSARLRGRFLLRPGLRARVGPADIDFAGGTLKLGSHPVSSALAGRIHAAFEEWDPRRVQGDAVWPHLNAKIDLHGPAEGLQFLDFYLRQSRYPRFAGGPGVLSIAGSIDGGIASGRVHLASQGARARLAKVELAGNVRAAARIARWDLEKSVLDLSGSSLELTDVVASGAADARGWWGRLELPRARRENGLRGEAKLECRDARPLFAILNVGLPRWSLGLVKLEGLTATAQLELASARTIVQGLEARGGKYRILGEYARRGERTRGAFLIEGGLLNVGVGIDDARTHVSLFGPRRWYEKQRVLVAEASEEPQGHRKAHGHGV